MKPCANGSVLLDGDFECHTGVCAGCAAFDPKRPATASGMCLEGSVLWKRDNTRQKRNALPGERDPHRASRDEVRRVTKFKDIA